ncbi:MAG: hypothetical protein OES24_17220 [Acidimicrobiia bacterium]|nr:hypothetical protein [Acidimicrobiia bacterium]
MADTDPTTQFLRSSMRQPQTMERTARRADIERVTNDDGRVGKVAQTRTVLWPRP